MHSPRQDGPGTYDVYFVRESGVARMHVRKVFASRALAAAYEPPEGFRFDKVRAAPHRLGLRGYR